jgi:N-acyl homoserine lactone hydrolase
MRLYLLQLGLLQPLRVPVLGYLIQTDDGINILVDSGYPYSFIDDPPGPQPPLNLQLEMRPGDYVVNQLASVGLRPDEMHYLVCTHFDPDHAGNHELFYRAELLVQRSHYEVARAGHARSQVVREHWDAPSLRYRLIGGDVTLQRGVELLETSGHVPSHQSLLVRLPQTGPILLAIDAVPTASQMNPDTRVVLPINDEDEAKTRADPSNRLEDASGAGLSFDGATGTGKTGCFVMRDLACS